MKKFLLATASSVAMISTVSAADLAARPYSKVAPMPMVAAIYDWSGFYIGLNGGGGWSHKCWDISDDAGLLISPLAAQGCH
jgi:outer membrane immunogenic protein